MPCALNENAPNNGNQGETLTNLVDFIESQGPAAYAMLLRPCSEPWLARAQPSGWGCLLQNGRLKRRERGIDWPGVIWPPPRR